MVPHTSISSKQFKQLVKHGQITMAGNKGLKIYGTLRCTSGKRMKKPNRVFFIDEHEALSAGYRPCGHCMRTAYVQWKNNSNTCSKTFLII